MLVNNTNVRANILTIYQDSLTKDTSQNLNYISYQKNPLIFDKAFLNGHFGADLTFNIDPFSNGNSRFFFQFTLGKTTNYPNWSSQEISTTPINVAPDSTGIITQEYEKITTGITLPIGWTIIRKFSYLLKIPVSWLIKEYPLKKII